MVVRGWREIEQTNSFRRGPAGSGPMKAANLRKIRLEFERPLVRRGLDEEVERIDDLHVGREIDGDGEFGGLFRKDEARQPIAVRVLLPVQEMLRRRDRQRIVGDAGAAVRRGPQPDYLRAEIDRPVIAVAGGVVEPDNDGHVTRYAPEVDHGNAQFPCNFRAAINGFREVVAVAAGALCLNQRGWRRCCRHTLNPYRPNLIFGPSRPRILRPIQARKSA